MIKVSDYIINFIAEQGIKDVFMLPGGGCMHIVDSLGKHPKINYIANLHEQGSAIAAEAYSQYNNNLGVALVTTGPGGTNAITGIANAWIESIPLLVLSGQVKRADLMKDKGVRQMGPQEVDIVSIVSSITKYAVTVMDPLKIKYHLEEAVYLAKNGRPGPVWLDIPLDVQGAKVEEKDMISFIPKKDVQGDFFSQIEETIKLINQAKRPVILAGNGIRLSDALTEFKELIAALNIPVLTTWKTIDFFDEDYELYFGRPGSIASRGANFVQQNSDLIITIGARLDYGQVAFSYENFAREAKKIIVDIDKNEINKINTQIDVEVNASAKEFILKLKESMVSIKKQNRVEWLKRCMNWKQKYPVIIDEHIKNKEQVNTYALVNVLSDLLKADDLIVPGSSGSCSEVTLQAFKVKEGQRVLNSPGLGSMGFGVVASIGACIASNRRRTICLIGDGGFQHNIQELELLKRYQLPIKIFVLNNNCYASIRVTQERHFECNYVACDPNSGLTLPDTINVAKAYKLKTKRISSQNNLKKEVEEVLQLDGPVICEVMINPNTYTSPKVSSEVKPDGKIVSKPMEDLWPFLDRDEFKSNMIIDPLMEEE